jgi:ubiquinone biosynthesis protein COQ4
MVDPFDRKEDRAMPSTTSTRLRPIAALRALRKLKQNGEDTRQVFLLLNALRGKTSQRQFARFCATETGRAVLAEKRVLLDQLNERDKLAALPEGTLGRGYYDFMAAERLSAQGLVDASQFDETLPPGEDMTLFRARSREMHDLLHVVTGYGRDPLGEGCLVAFSYAQTGLKGFALIAVWAAQRIARRLRRAPVRRAVFEGYRHGRRAEWLWAADWEALLAEPIAAIRARYHIAEPQYYPQVLASMRVLQAAKAETASAAA